MDSRSNPLPTEKLPPSVSTHALAIIDKADRASAMLERATNEYGQIYVRDQAQAAAHILKLDGIVKQASVMVQRAEGAIANPFG